MKNRLRNIFLIVGFVAIVVMILTFKVSFVELWQDVCKAGYWLVAIIGLWGVLYAMNALAWKIILSGSGEVLVSFKRLYKLTITGFALNYATPVGLLGGEPYKIVEITPFVGVQRATSSVVLFAMMHIFAHFCFWITAIMTYVVMAFLGLLPMDGLMTVLLLLMTLFCSVGVYLFTRGYKTGLIVKLIRFLGHLPFLKGWAERFQESHKEDLQKIDDQIAQLHSQNKRSFYASFMVEFVGRMLQSLEIYFMLRLFCIEDMGIIQLIHSFLILAFTSLFANLLFFFPLQLGGREGGFAMSTAQMGMTNEIGLFISIICRVREIFWTAVGLLLIKVGNEKN